jgi:hypothetical protein
VRVGLGVCRCTSRVCAVYVGVEGEVSGVGGWEVGRWDVGG